MAIRAPPVNTCNEQTSIHIFTTSMKGHEYGYSNRCEGLPSTAGNRQ